MSASVLPDSGDHTGQTVAAVCQWYAQHRRDLPWRAPDVTAWGVLVSEVMLQQTPVARVAPAWQAWMLRWPSPAELAADSVGETVRMWGRLGYPRRALRLHSAAVACVELHDGHVPSTYEQLLALPGVGDYTAAAVMSFGYGQRAVVLDTNVRRVLARLFAGQGMPRPSVSVAERAMAESILPADDTQAATWSIAAMELGALVCTSAAPSCASCPVSTRCAWFASGSPAYDGPVRAVQRFAGTDRQVRGLLLSVLREASGPVSGSALDLVWSDATQRGRALDGLVADGLVEPLAHNTFSLPS